MRKLLWWQSNDSHSLVTVVLLAFSRLAGKKVVKEDIDVYFSTTSNHTMNIMVVNEALDLLASQKDSSDYT